MNRLMRGSHGREDGSHQIFSYLLFIFASSSLPLSNGEDRLTIGMSIRGNQTLTSDGESFAIGFFSPGNSTNQYLGIWYNKIPGQAVVWIANRNNPLSRNSSGVFMLNRDGNLVLMDGTRYVWSSNISFVTGTVSNSTVVILENSGNLILRDGVGMVLWRSFDHPTHTLLPGMKIGLNKKTGQNGLLTSWKAEDDPRSGDFAIGVDPRRPIQLTIWNKSLLHWRSNVWDGSLFQTTIEGSRNNYLSYIAYAENSDGFYMTFGVSDSSIVSRWVLNTTGVVELLSWQENSKKWAVLWGFPRDECDIYGRCGPFGSCDTNNKPGICNCLTGFKPTIQKDWENGNWSGGCVRQKELKCDKGDEFIRLEGMKLPDHSIAAGNLTVEQCEIQCQKNCSCIAYAYVNTSTVGVKWRCIHWGGDLTDLRRIYDGRHDLYVRLDGSELGASGRGQGGKTKKMIVIPVAIIIGILLIGTLCCLFHRRNKFKRPKRGSDMGIKFKASTSLGSKNGSEVNSFSLSSILAATDSFSAANKLGEGGFGPVYQGSLVDGREIAVKRLSKKSGQGLEEFMNEVTVIAKLQHKNLVRLLGCCIQKEEKMLIYEYMPNKSLDKHLFDPSKQVNLDWSLRFGIIEGIAQGILYLHKYSRLRIIHRDLKASNILLDDSMNPKISDFGMARIFGGNQTEANTGRVVGTLGYMSPEYALNGHFSEKSDVFSFGVLLIEIISSKRNTGLYPTDHTPTLLGYAWELWREDRALELIDQSIRDSCTPRQVLKCIQIGLLCVQEDAATRPTMSSVVSMLGNDNSTLPLPEQPGFFMKRSSTVVDSGNSSKESQWKESQSYSINEVTITSTLPR